MNRDAIQQLLEQVKEGKISPDTAIEKLAQQPFQELSHSTLDLHRELRQGSPEVIFGENKSAEQISDNLAHLFAAHGKALATRVSDDKAKKILAHDHWGSAPPQHNASARCLSLGLNLGLPSTHPITTNDANDNGATITRPYIAIVTAGTSDLPVSDEAALTLQFLDHQFVQISDVGVAGIHRLLPHLDTLRHATAVIAIAGMEGALPSVLGGLLSAPLIAVPTSTGYGTARHGETALHAMLTSCASGIAVVNIDNGFGAALFAHTILNQLK